MVAFLRSPRSALSLLPLALGVPAQETTPSFDFEALAKSELASLNLEEGSANGPTTFEDVLGSEGFARVELASFDLFIPIEALKDDHWAKAFREAGLTLIDLSRTWMVWRDPSLEQNEAVVGDWSVLRKWVQSWSSGALARCKGGSAGSLFEELGAKEKVLEAAERLKELTRPDAATSQAVGERNRIAVGPSRKHFLELVSIAGWLHPQERDALWSAAVIEQTAAWHGWSQIIALENSPIPLNPVQPFPGVPMTDRDDTGLAQSVADRGAAILLRKEFLRQGTHFFEESLGTNLVIASVGKNDMYSGPWKLELRYTGETTQPYERFVPGGNSAGGTLPPRKAGLGIISGSATEISRYRETQGEDYFLGPLREGQKAGGQLAQKDKANPLHGDRLAHFELLSFETRGTHAVTAPFLGPHAEGKALPPNEFLDDYEDFFRAYRSAFVRWLQTEGAGDAKASEAKFAELIAKQASRDPSKTFHAVVEEVYGTPLSHSSGELDNLEWRFLDYLGHGR